MISKKELSERRDGFLQANYQHYRLWVGIISEAFKTKTFLM
jgi:hypothetical protein